MYCIQDPARDTTRTKIRRNEEISSRRTSVPINSHPGPSALQISSNKNLDMLDIIDQFNLPES